MLKRSITFDDFNGDTVTEVHYFNLTKTELVELEVAEEGGLEANLRAVIEAKDNKTIFAQFKKIVLQAYGEKSTDGKRFVKSDELREEFSQTAAFDALMMELVTDENKTTAFIMGLVPKDMSEGISKEELKANVAEVLGVQPQKSTAELAAEQA